MSTVVNPNIMFITIAPLLDQIALQWGAEPAPRDLAPYRTFIEELLPDGYYLTDIRAEPFGLTIAAPSIGRRYLIEATPRAITIKSEAFNVH